MTDTKDRIIDAAIQLFNEQGFVNVRLQHIADDLKISVGNLAYHYKNKASIVSKAYERIGEELSRILSSYRSSPDLRDLDHQLDLYYHFIKKFPFYFIDILEVKRNHPHLHDVRKDFLVKMKIQFAKRLEYNIQRGVIRKNLQKKQIQWLADNLCSTVTFWHTSRTIMDESRGINHFKDSVWIQIHPLLTTKGLREFNEHIMNSDLS